MLSFRILLTIYSALIVAPLALSAIGLRAPRSVWDELASGTGMVAFAIILVDFTLSGRFRKISRQVGMDITMRVHQLIARTALAAALIHPFLYQSERDAPYPWDVTRELTVTTEFGLLWSGIIAWLLLPTLVLLALNRGEPNYRYETWRWMHGIGAVMIAGLVLHHSLVAGRYSDDPWLAGYWVGLSVVAALSIVWVYVIVPARQHGKPWKVSRVESVAERIWHVEVAPDGHPGWNYEAGQFAWLNLGASPFRHRENPFSIASAPASGPNLSFLIKELGDTTSRIGDVKVGSMAYVDGPHGALTLSDDAPGVGLIAGGIGIAPLIGILRQMSLTHDPRQRKLVYADKAPDQIVHRGELEQFDKESETEIAFVYDRPPKSWSGDVGRVDKAMLARRFSKSELSEWVFILCGPPPMLDAVETALSDLGVSPDRILSERFDYD